ncbi:TetR/AcrR family transcriptional regulator [bacterium]|nr:TetR/AcrR family transcriptional regulator [bacterium]
MSRILDAAERVIGERGFAAATVADIVKEAKSSVGVFYDRFKDKETLLDCLHERFCQESYATADEALDPSRWKDATLEQILNKLVRFLVQIYREHLGLLRAFMVRCGVDRRFAERGMQLQGYIARKLALLLLAHRNEIPHPRPEFAVEFGLRMVGSTLDSFVLFDDVDVSGIGLHDEETSQELIRAFSAYLGVGVASRKKQRVGKKT